MEQSLLEFAIKRSEEKYGVATVTVNKQANMTPKWAFVELGKGDRTDIQWAGTNEGLRLLISEGILCKHLETHITTVHLFPL